MNAVAPDIPPRPRRPEIRRLISAGWSDEEIIAQYHDRWRAEIAGRLREIRDAVERNNADKIRLKGPFRILYTSHDGVNVYDVGGGHAVRGEQALKALGFEGEDKNLLVCPAVAGGGEA